MNLRYIRFFGFKGGYGINCPDIAFYKCEHIALPYGIYKFNHFGLCFWASAESITNRPLGIKIDR